MTMPVEILELNQFNHELFQFLDASPTPFHVVQQQISRLEAYGFERLDESQQWSLQSGKRYYVSRNNSSLIAFIYGTDDIIQTGIRMLGAHTDSPCLKVKPNADIISLSYLKIGVEVYGGALLNPWFDRDLSLAGKIVYQTKKQQVKTLLLDFEQAIACIPSLAIHLDRDDNKNRSINAQTDIPPVMMLIDPQQSTVDFKSILLKQAKKQNPLLDIEQILDYELSFYDTQQASNIGLNNDFIASSRLDNLLSCYTGMQALMRADTKTTSLLVCSDHEEVGSASSSGAQGPFLKSVLERIAGSNEILSRIIDRSMLISADNAHAVHPNFPDKHDANHGPVINNGPVIKVNANQRYASNSETAAVFKVMAQAAEIPVQSFVVRTDMGCGSTIGPIAAAEIGVKTLDIGVPTFAMHSIRELAGSKDSWYLFKVLQKFFSSEYSVNISDQL